MNNMTLTVVMFVIVIVVGLILLFVFAKFQPRRPLKREWYQAKWQTVEAQFADGPSGQALAVVNADKLLDRAMQDKGYAGQTMGERLKKHPNSFADINAIWRAHKLRNRIAHDHSQVYEAECRSALTTFRQGLKDLGAL